MYHYRLVVKLIGLSDAAQEGIRSTAIPADIEIEYASCDSLDQALANDSSLIIWQADRNQLSRIDSIPSGIQLILVWPEEAFDSLTPYLSRITDVWADGITKDEAAFRFTHWLAQQKATADAWQTEHYLDTTINSVPNLIWYKTKDGVHEKVNDSFCETVGKTKEQVQGQKHAYIWDVEEDDPACIESENEVMALGKTCVSEENVSSGDGEKLLTVYKSPLYNIDGSVMGTVGVAIDITQERAYEKSLLEKNATLENIFTSLDCGIVTHSLDGSNIISINKAALDILGYDSKEQLEADGFDMIAPSVMEEDRERLRERIAALKDESDSNTVEYRVVRDDGDIRYVTGSIKLIRINGELFYQRFLLDSTDQHLEIQHKERKQRELLQALSSDYVVVCAFDLDTDVSETLRISTEQADALSKIFIDGQTLDSCISEYCKRRVHEDDREGMLENMKKESILEKLSKDNRTDFMFRLNVDNRTEYIQATFVRAGDWVNHHLAVFGLKNVDKQIRGELEQKALLQEALNKANEANEAKSRFLSNMSHDIRTPMNAILGFTSLAISRVDQQDAVLDYLDKIQSSSKHLLSLINDVLDMSRIESGMAELDVEVCNMKDILSNLDDIMQPTAKDKSITLTVDDGDLGDQNVYCDKLKLNQILINLVGNAIKFTQPDGSVTVKADHPNEAPQGFVGYRIQIIDSGIGIDPDFIDHLFTPFERERTSTISGIQGTGLGLAITKNLVEMMHGSIDVASTPGIGSTFTVRLAFKAADEEVVAEEESVTSAPERLIGSRLLLVEDNEFNQEIASTLLTDAGFEVERVSNGQEAIDAVAAQPANHYRFVLMDVQMPVMNGYDATQAIRNLDDEAKASIPIIALTADAFDEDRQKASKCGMNGHITKPIEIDKLFKTLNDIL